MTGQQLTIAIAVFAVVVAGAGAWWARQGQKDGNAVAQEAVRAQDDANDIAQRETYWTEMNDTIDTLRTNLAEALTAQQQLREEVADARTEQNRLRESQEKLRLALQAAMSNVLLLQQYIDSYVPADAPKPPKLWKVSPYDG